MDSSKFQNHQNYQNYQNYQNHQNHQNYQNYQNLQNPNSNHSKSFLNHNKSIHHNQNLNRSKTLTRPERYVTPAPLITPINNNGINNDISFSNLQTNSNHHHLLSWFAIWSFYVNLLTLPFPSFFLSSIGLKDPIAQQAWREKVALCSIAIISSAFTGFVTIGMNKALCPESDQLSHQNFIQFNNSNSIIGISGWAFNITNHKSNLFNFLPLNHSGLDITNLFDQSNSIHNSCQSLSGQFTHSNLCANLSNPNSSCPLPNLNQITLNNLQISNTSLLIGYTWDQINSLNNYFVINGVVLNMNSYLASTQSNQNDIVDRAIRQILQSNSNSNSMGKDATRLFSYHPQLVKATDCLKSRFKAGVIDKITPGCFVSQLFLYVSLIVILGVVLVRFLMAIFFSWFMSNHLIRPPRNLRRKVISPAVLPIGANLSLMSKNGTAPWAINTNQFNNSNSTSNHQNKNHHHLIKSSFKLNEKSSNLQIPIPLHSSKTPKSVDSNGLINMASIGPELFCVCLVTCYSEGPDGIQKTLDSISASDYSDARKLLFVVCDGIITGHGEKLSTPDICINLIDPDPRFINPIPMSYRAVAAGTKQINQALVYAGHYTKVKGRQTPIIVVVKSGTKQESDHEKKPGNRGKRDSQMILMNFFSRVTYNDRMSPLDYDLFRKIHALMGVTPDFFEVCLMVDADTTVMKDSIGHLVNCMHYDPLIMGVCGETRIANKRQSWVTAIQVFEYYISHHLAKAFESVFGGVTCLPGCFSMYRLKSRRLNDGDWVPILVQPEICREYSQSIVNTLHQKNLLLLGEDRFLTTLMIRTFPARKMMFCPQAKCRTIVPDQFSILVSQRRRWINSTIHNLMELVRVPNLCGTFCLSMQFVVFMELIGTIVLPIAITLTYSLIINSILHRPKDFSDAIPLILLAAILGLPALLILTTTMKVSYVFWMLIYLIALPVWNFVLPLYAFWHFDDFSWGETRKVEGEVKAEAHGTELEITLESNSVPLRRWEDWERSRLKKIKREEKRKREFERAFGARQFYSMTGSEMGDEASMVSSEDDRWGMNIGNYDEFEVTRPPVGLYHVDEVSSINGGTMVNGDELQMMLETGWGDEDEFPAPQFPLPSRPNVMRSQTELQIQPMLNDSSNSSSCFLPSPTYYGQQLPLPPKKYQLEDG